MNRDDVRQILDGIDEELAAVSQDWPVALVEQGAPSIMATLERLIYELQECHCLLRAESMKAALKESG